MKRGHPPGASRASHGYFVVFVPGPCRLVRSLSGERTEAVIGVSGFKRRLNTARPRSVRLTNSVFREMTGD